MNGENSVLNQSLNENTTQEYQASVIKNEIRQTVPSELSFLREKLQKPARRLMAAVRETLHNAQAFRPQDGKLDILVTSMQFRGGCPYHSCNQCHSVQKW
jgi:hypothetical protein